jgi:hypothetical protein
MAGEVIRVISRRRVNLSANTQLATAQEIMLATHVRVYQWRELVAYVRLHNPSTNSQVGWLTSPRLVFYQDGWTNEDPSFVSVSSPGGNDIALPALPSAGTAFTTFALPANFGSLLSISVVAQPGGPVTCDIWLSVDLSGKE